MLKSRKLPLGALRKEYIDYLSGFFGEFLDRNEVNILVDEARKRGDTHACPFGTKDEKVDQYMREIVECGRNAIERQIRRDHGTASERFMRGYFDGLPPISLYRALNMAISLSTNKDAAKRSR